MSHDVISLKAIFLAASGTLAAATSYVPAHVFGQFLTTNGMGILSYAEWLQVLGGIYVFSLLIRTVVWPCIKPIIDLIRKR